MNENELQNDQHYEDDGFGVSRWHSMRVTERWDTLGPDGKTVITNEGSRDDAISHHLRSNAAFSYHVQFMAERGETVENYATPLCGVRRVLRYETGAHWEVVTNSEGLSEETEILKLKDCDHPPRKRVSNGTYCSRCGAKIERATA